MNLEPISQFDEVYVISDLHMGGETTARQIFDQGPLLAAWIASLTTKKNADKDIALVINGDMVDFLAEEGATHFDPAGAVRKLERIVGDASFKPVWNALQDFVSKPRRQLIVTMGNHDLELSLPWVRDSLLKILSKDDDAARGRITLQLDGRGFRCRVGGSTVYCVHGNDVDPWNLTDYEHLRRLGRDLWQGLDVEPWIPNAGTQLVIDVMNAVKRKFPFVDLLKPETDAVIPVLAALDPSQVNLQNLDKAIGVAKRLTWDKVKRRLGFLAIDPKDSEQGSAAASPKPGAMLAEVLRQSFGPRATSASVNQQCEIVEQLLSNAHKALKGDSQTSVGQSSEDFLGKWSAITSFFQSKSKAEVLRSYLDGLKKDQSFEIGHPDETFERTDDIVSTEFDFVITGHTHQEKALRRRHGGMYYNSGTWVRLIQLEDEVLDSETEFAKAFKAFSQGSMIKLDECDDPKLVIRKPAVVSIVDVGGTAKAALNHVADKPNAPSLIVVPGSEYPR